MGGWWIVGGGWWVGGGWRVGSWMVDGWLKY